MGLTWNELLAQVETIPFEELRDNYPVGDTMVKKTITTIVEGEKPREVFFPEKPPVPFEKMAILGTSLTGSEYMWQELGGTHFIANDFTFSNHELIESLGMKVIINLKPPGAGVPTEEFVIKRVEKFMGKDVCGGWWISDEGIRGEEPDGQPWTPEYNDAMLIKRIWIKELVELIDPNHCFFEQFDLTETGIVKGHWRPGWGRAYNEKTLDKVLFDCYSFDQDDEKMRDEIRKFYDMFPGNYCKRVEVIPQLNAFQYRKGCMWTAYNAWKDCIGKPIALAFYKDETVRRDAEMQKEIKEVIADVMA